MRLALADDHEIVRRGLRTLIEAQQDLELVGEVDCGPDVAPLVARTRPDLLLLDLMMPGLTGLELLPGLRQSAPETRILVFSMHAEETYVAEALAAGATGYVTKDVDTDELVRAIRIVGAGERFLSAALPASRIERRLQEGAADPLAGLTPREREVFGQAVRGQTNADIATNLFLSSRTVEKHRATAMRKLGLNSTNDAVRFAYEHALLSPAGNS